MRTIQIEPGKIYDVTRPDGGSFTFAVDRLTGRWVYGRASGGYVGALKRSNVRGPCDPVGPFFTMVEVTTCG